MPREHPVRETWPQPGLGKVPQEASEGLEAKQQQMKGGERTRLESGYTVGSSATGKGCGQIVANEGAVAGPPGVEDLTGLIQGWEVPGKTQWKGQAGRTGRAVTGKVWNLGWTKRRAKVLQDTEDSGGVPGPSRAGRRGPLLEAGAELEAEELEPGP